MDTFLIISNIALWLVVILQMVLFFVLTKTMSDFMKRFKLLGREIEFEKLQIGKMAPLFREFDQHGNLIKLTDSMEKPTLLLFKSSKCPTCQQVMEKLPLLAAMDYDIRILVFSKESDDLGHAVSSNAYHLLRSDRAFDEYKIQKSPTAVLLDANLVVKQVQELADFNELKSMLETQSQLAS